MLEVELISRLAKEQARRESKGLEVDCPAAHTEQALDHRRDFRCGHVGAIFRHLAIVAAAWPDFACRESGRKNWLLGHVGPLSGAIPHRAAVDLGVPVVFANQVGTTQTYIPILRTRIADRFAGRSTLADGRHGPPKVAGVEEEVLMAKLTIHPSRGPVACRSTSVSAPAA